MKYWFVLVLAIQTITFVFADWNAALEKFSTPTGFVDDCCCQVDDVNRANDAHVSGLLDKIVKRKYFKYFKTNLDVECPFWVVSKTCGLSGGCSVCECDQNEVPLPFMSETTDQVDRHIAKDFNPWIDDQKSMWLKPVSESGFIYVDLTKNPEVNTGYVGPEANRVWMAIYKENCFPVNSQCIEERVFFRLISGFHSSITAHIFRYFHKTPSGQWDPNLEGFIKTLGAFPDRMKNLHFTYLFLLRAVNRAMPFLLTKDYDTGNPDHDAETKQLVHDFYRLKQKSDCSIAFDGFNETELFVSDRMHLKADMQEKFRNVSSILNCIACESCRLLAHVKILGIGTALKILFHEGTHDLSLQRNEVIALFNTLQQFSHSLRIINDMGNLKKSMHPESSRHFVPISSLFVIGVVAFLLVLMLFFFFRNNQQEQSEKSTKTE